MSDLVHIPVLLDQVLELCAARQGETIVDCTVGRGGHALALAGAVGASGRLVGFDLDPENLKIVSKKFDEATTELAQFLPIHDSFVRVPQQLRSFELRADVVLADLGFSSAQMDDPLRGFSFRVDGPLDMRFDLDSPITASKLLAVSTEEELADIIFKYGEEPLARIIARKLAQSRQRTPIESTTQLAELVVEAYGARARNSRVHPATRTFMALRIAVNDELGALGALLDQIATGVVSTEGGRWLNPGARIGVISFHSLEDRMVKRAFRYLAQQGLATVLTKRPWIAGDNEIAANPRSRSAKLRVVRIKDEPQRPMNGN